MINLGVRKCRLCLTPFHIYGHKKYCSDECSSKWKAYDKEAWDILNHEHIMEYSKKYQPRNNDLRRVRRQQLYEYWGRSGRIDWRLAEDVSIDILKQEGFEDVKCLTNHSIQVPFDIIGFKQDQGFVFQVTTRSHTYKNWQHKLARDMRLIHKVLFISMKNNTYVLKDFSPSGISELNMMEVKQARRFS